MGSVRLCDGKRVAATTVSNVIGCDNLLPVMGSVWLRDVNVLCLCTLPFSDDNAASSVPYLLLSRIQVNMQFRFTNPETSIV